ncbi:MAG: lysylphosphatidylglycerol synthase transmembrane domain-containing protein [Candidatus Hydrogenedentota bacterium]
MKRNLFKIIFLFFIALLFILIAIKVEIKSLKETILNFKWYYFIYFTLLYILTYILYSQKIVYLFTNIIKLKFYDIYNLIFSGSYINFIFPGIGEIFKVIYLKQKYELSIIKSTIVLLFERIFTFMTLPVIVIIVAVLTGFKIQDTLSQYKIYVIFFLLTLIVSFAAIYLLSIKRDYFIPLIYMLTQRIPLLRVDMNKIEDVFSTSDIIFKPLFLFVLSIIIFLQLFFDGLRHYTLFMALDYNISFLICIAAYICVALITNIPGIPAKIGTFEAVYLSIFHFILNVPIDTCIVIIACDRVFSMINLFIFGLISFNYLNINWNEIRILKKKVDNGVITQV